MKKFLISLLIFCLAPLPILFFGAHVVDSGLRKSHYTYYDEWNELFNGRINADLLVMGSSRAWVHFSPKILDSTLNLNCYNLGLDGSPFELQYKRFKMYLQHNKKPRYIVQEVGLVATLAKGTEVPGTQQFLPYLQDTMVWGIVSNSNTHFNIFDKYFPLYKYNNELVLIKEGIMSYRGKGIKPVKYKGYQGQEKPWDNSFEDFKAENPGGWGPRFDTESVALFHEFLSFCKTNDIKVVMVYPPVYYGITEMLDKKIGDKIFGEYRAFSKEFDFPFLDYTNDSLTLTKANFYNSQHLNKSGSEQFSRKFALTLKEIISPSQVGK